MNKEEAYRKIIGCRHWLERLQDCIQYLITDVKELNRCIEDAKEDLAYTEEYMKKFQPKKEMEKDN